MISKNKAKHYLWFCRIGQNHHSYSCFYPCTETITYLKVIHKRFFLIYCMYILFLDPNRLICFTDWCIMQQQASFTEKKGKVKVGKATLDCKFFLAALLMCTKFGRSDKSGLHLPGPENESESGKITTPQTPGYIKPCWAASNVYQSVLSGHNKKPKIFRSLLTLAERENKHLQTRRLEKKRPCRISHNEQNGPMVKTSVP